MYFDFDDRYQAEGGVESAIARRDGVLLSIVVHASLIALYFLLPYLGLFTPANAAEIPQRQPEPRPERPEFVFVQPREDFEANQARLRADNSDKTRRSRAPEVSRTPSNPLPRSRGNSPERAEALPDARARGRGPAPEPAPETPRTEMAQRQPEPLVESPAAALPRPQQQPPQPQAPPAGGSLGEALRNLQKYVEKEQFNNPNGGLQDLGPLQFDTKGVEFGPWIRRFIAQVRRNWFVPYAAMSMSGRVVLQFNVHKDGRITDLTVVRPSGIDSFNTSAANALAGSNPTEPLPPEYPDDKAFFTVTFYYNESPDRPQQQR
jgi:TonB family protein